jgi:hypothetical protein
VFFVLRFGKCELRRILNNEVIICALLSKLSVLTVVVFSLYICAASESWFGALLEKAFLLFVKQSQNRNFVTRRCSIAHYVRSTGCKSLFCGFASQKYSTKNQLTTCG